MTTTTTAVPNQPPDSGRRWAYVGITLGGAVSVAANVAHSFVPPHGAPADWHPQTGAVFGAIVWPVFLFVAIEILIANHWPTGARYWVLRFGGLLPVATVAAIVSYRHLSGLLAFYGEDRLVVTIGPAAVDGLMAMATGALYAARHAHTTTTAPATVTPTPATTQSSTVDTTPVTTSRPVKAPAKRAPAKKTTPAAKATTPAAKRAPVKKTTPPAVTPATTPALDPQPATVTTLVEPTPAPDVVEIPVPPHLVSTAQFAVTNHHSTTGGTITPHELAARMSISTDLASRLLSLVDLPGPKPVVTTGTNGTPLRGDR